MSLDLRTGRSVWLTEEKEKLSYKSLTEDISAEVVVVGGGVSGALVAHRLINTGMDVVLVDSRGIASGSTFASTAILSYETDLDLNELSKKVGMTHAVRVFRLGAEGIDYIEKIVNELGEECDFKRRNSVYFASTASDAKKIKEEFKLRKEHGFDPEFISIEKFKTLFSFSAYGAILTPKAAEINPVKFTRALIRNATSKGLRVFTDTKIVKYNGDNAEPFAVTDRGCVLRAKYFIFATGYETEEFLKQSKVTLASTYAIASLPLDEFPQWYERSILWETARPYLYIRTTADNRILVGGEDVNFVNEQSRDELLKEKSKILQDKFKKMFPQIPFKFSTAWTGTFAETDDSLPYIGRHKDWPGAYFALGYGGNGMTFDAIASKIIEDLILGKENRDASIFAFNR